MSSTLYTLLSTAQSTAGLKQADPVSATLIENISAQMTGKALSDNLGYFSLGFFYIDAELLEQHPTQRPVNSVYVDKLVSLFESGTIQRSENAGVVIGLGEGWNKLKNIGPIAYRITQDCSLVDDLSIGSGGAIGQVIRGGHRTEAVRRLSQMPEMGEEGYWYYQVLVPSKCSHYY